MEDKSPEEDKAFHLESMFQFVTDKGKFDETKNPTRFSVSALLKWFKACGTLIMECDGLKEVWNVEFGWVHGSGVQWTSFFELLKLI